MLDNKLKNYKMILLLGCSIDDMAYDKNAVLNEKQKYCHTDSILLLIINKKTLKIKLVSFMRDIWVSIQDKGFKKLNAAYVLGGPELTIKTINEHFDLNIDNYVLTNIENMIEIVDLIGGIDINLTKKEVDYINEWVANVKLLTRTNKKTIPLTNEGLNHLNGTQTLAHVRNRTIGYCWKRGYRQRETLKTMAKKVKETMSPFQIFKLAKTTLKYVKTDIKKIDIIKYIILLLITHINKIQTYCIPQEGTYQMVNDGIWRFELDFDKSKKLLHNFILNNK